MSNSDRNTSQLSPTTQGTTNAPAVIEVLLPVLNKLAEKLDAIHLHLTERTKSFYTVDEVAKLTGRSAYTVRRWITEGVIAATRVTGTGPKGKLLIAADQMSKLLSNGFDDKLEP